MYRIRPSEGCDAGSIPAEGTKVFQLELFTNMPLHFHIILLAQFIVFMTFAMCYRKKKKLLINSLVDALCLGLVLGIIFDLLCGLLNIHFYIGGNSVPFCLCGLSFAQLVLNGIFSYGLAVASAFYITPPAHMINDVDQKRTLQKLSLFIFLTAILLTIVLPKGSIVIFFAAGLAVVSAGELVMILRGYVGPIFSVFVTRQYKTLQKVWAQVIIIAMCYELANYLFNFWVWLPGSHYNQILLEFIVIVFAYAGLFHPMFIFWQMRAIRSDK